MTEVVIVRHGETEYNKLGVFRGRLDVPLNDRGREQAAWAAAALRSKPLAAVFSSPLVRALDTAGAIAAAHGLTPIVDQAFQNIDLGEWQGVEKARVEREEPDLWDLWMNDPDALRIPGGETLADVRERAYRRALELVWEYRGNRVAVVTHRSVAKLLGGALLGMEPGYFWKFYLDNAGFSIVGHHDGGFVLLTWNESCHLKERVIERY
jgi:broad specificity phosphatase PhoE